MLSLPNKMWKGGAEGVVENINYLFDVIIKFYKRDGDSIKDVSIYLGTETMKDGVAEVILDKSFGTWYIVLASADTETTSSYVVKYISNRKFKISSSLSTDTSSVKWMAIGY